MIGTYIAWLIRAGFLDKPEGKGEKDVPVLTGGVDKAMGRTTAGK
jgi:L-aminoadipate-semialdehyde dehydrogenase